MRRPLRDHPRTSRLPQPADGSASSAETLTSAPAGTARKGRGRGDLPELQLDRSSGVRYGTSILLRAGGRELMWRGVQMDYEDSESEEEQEVLGTVIEVI